MIRVYGISVGNGSFARVTAGICSALRDLELFAGLVPVDTYDEEISYPGAQAEIGVYVGPPAMVGLMSTLGWHEERLAFLVANSTWMPKELVSSMEKKLSGFLAPSRWAAEVLRGYTKLPVDVWQHGISGEFAPFLIDGSLFKSYDEDIFRVGHLASTHLERKGTKELVLGWDEFVRSTKVELKATLTLILEGPHEKLQSNKTINCYQRQNLDKTQMGLFYRQNHLIAQPSRGEGFGMVPLEVRGCGIPVMMTSCTGHKEHINPLSRSTVHVATGQNVPIDDGPGALAPYLSVNAVSDSLTTAYVNWKQLYKFAQEEAYSVHTYWNWTEVTKRWLLERNS